MKWFLNVLDAPGFCGASCIKYVSSCITTCRHALNTCHHALNTCLHALNTCLHRLLRLVKTSSIFIQATIQGAHFTVILSLFYRYFIVILPLFYRYFTVKSRCPYPCGVSERGTFRDWVGADEADAGIGGDRIAWREVGGATKQYNGAAYGMSGAVDAAEEGDEEGHGVGTRPGEYGAEAGGSEEGEDESASGGGGATTNGGGSHQEGVAPEASFDRVDVNHDGVIDRDEWAQHQHKLEADLMSLHRQLEETITAPSLHRHCTVTVPSPCQETNMSLREAEDRYELDTERTAIEAMPEVTLITLNSLNYVNFVKLR